jgi:leukotriene-A4 hydrolase
MRYLSCALLLLLLFGCKSQSSESYYRYDPHSASRPNDAVATHLHWSGKIDFEAQRIEATARWQIKVNQGVREIIFDTDELEIIEISLNNQQATLWRMGEKQPFIGSALVIDVDESTQFVNIRYRTHPDAKALQWLAPQQTHGQAQPFLFTQGQAVLTRSWLPCQDSPGIRFSFEAQVQVPPGLFALMSAANPKHHEENGIYRFSNKHPIPAYLFALAVGDITYKPYDARSGVYAEPGMLTKAWHEFSNLPAMIKAAEELYGPYPWDRYDVLVLPPSFPFGGMENPMLMFATPSIISGDRSLTNLIAHELSHSWSGNLVTNASWNDFWVNEGFTTYIERRIIAAIHGQDYADMLGSLGNQDLEQTIEQLRDRPELTRLKLALEGKNPDDALNRIPYQKGFAFLDMLEREVGQERMDAFVKKNYDTHAFASMNTEDFIAFLKSNLLDEAQMERLKVHDWIYGEGLPMNYQPKVSSRFMQVDEVVHDFKQGTAVLALPTAGWSTYEWIYFLRKISAFVETKQLALLDKHLGFSKSGNSELQLNWFLLCIEKCFDEAIPDIENYLASIGRRKLVVPLFTALHKRADTREYAHQLYLQLRPGYHQVTSHTLDQLFGIALD